MSQVNCTVPDCPNNGKYCRLHFGFTPEKETKPIAPVSKKRAAINKDLYGPASKRFVKANPICQLGMEGCKGKSECVHHTKGKDSTEMLLDEQWWKASCYHCNTMVEILDADARSKDLKLSKFNNHSTNN